MPRTAFRREAEQAGLAARWCAALLMAQLVGGKAVRDALYLENLPGTSLPGMILVAALFSVAVAMASARMLRHLAPVRFLVWALVACALTFVATWALFDEAPATAAVVLYLQVSVLGPVLGSGLWLIAAERFDPRTARRVFARMVSAGTAGGLAGGLVAERVASRWGTLSVLLLLAALGLVTAFHVARLREAPGTAHAVDALPAELAPTGAESSLLALARAPFLRTLALMVLLGTVAATLLDYRLKVYAQAGSPDRLLQFFAWYYAVTALSVFVVQTVAQRRMLEAFGLARTLAAPAAAVIAGGVGALAAPGLATAAVVRGGEAILRGSLFRSAYEICFTPLPSGDKRAVKSMIDVGVDRLGEAAGAGLIALVLLLMPAWQHEALVAMAMASSVVALFVARRLMRGYVGALERSLKDRAVALSLPDVVDQTTRAVLWHTMAAPLMQTGSFGAGDAAPATASRGSSATPEVFNSDVLQILALRSGDPVRVARVLDEQNTLTPALIAHVIPLLGSAAVAPAAARALVAVGEHHVGELADAMLDARRPIDVRRRLARVLQAIPSRRAIDGLMLGLDDSELAVRVQCGRSLAAAHRHQSAVAIDDSAIFAAVLGEVARGRTVWESHRWLAAAEDEEDATFLDGPIRERTHQGLAHVFTLLSIVLPSEPLRIAYQGLQTDDPVLRGTALEYLESVLPPRVREALWPFLDDPRTGQAPPMSRAEVVARLMRSHPSILINLKRHRGRRPDPGHGDL